MGIRKESLNGGLVQTRHPALLRDGELQRADDTILRPGDPAIHRAPGRTVFGTVRSTTVACTLAGTSTLGSTAGFGTDIASVTTVLGSPFITSSTAFGSVEEGQTIRGTGIPDGTYVQRKISSSKLEMTKAATAAGTVTITHSDFHPGTRITGTDIPSGTVIGTITSEDELEMVDDDGNPVNAESSNPQTLTFSERVSGLRALTFDRNNQSIMLAKAADKLYSAPLDDVTGTFTELQQNLSHEDDSTLEAIHYRDRHIVLTGSDIPKVVYYSDDGDGNPAVTSRSVGMLPVSDFVGPSLTAGQWTQIDEAGAGWYYFLVTEVAIYGQDDEVEGTFVGTPKAIQIENADTEAVLITYHNTASQAVNDGNYGRNTATHWRVYASKKAGAVGAQPVQPGLSSFTRVATVPIANTSVTIGEGNVFQFGYASDVIDVTNRAKLFPDGFTGATAQTLASTLTCTLVEGSNVIEAASGMLALDEGMPVVSTGNYLPYGTVITSVVSDTRIVVSENATFSTSEVVGFGNSRTYDNTWSDIPQPVDLTSTNQREGIFQDFGFQDIGGFNGLTITGVKVEIIGRLHGVWPDSGLEVRLNINGNGGTFSQPQYARFKPTPGATGDVTKIELGGDSDDWGMTLSSVNFANAGIFGVAVRKLPSQHWDGDILNRDYILSEPHTHQIDGIKVTVYGGTTAIRFDGEPFRTVQLQDQLGVVVDSGANGPPPIASTGDVFDGALLLNDKKDESVLVSSLGGEEEAFPDIYRLPLESRDTDQIRVIRRLNHIAIIGCLNSVKRLNYFPKEDGASSQRGRAYEDLATDHGMVGPRAVSIVTIPQRGTMLVYLAHNGLHWTDGVTTAFVNEDIDWEGLIEPSLIARSVVEVYPRLSMLALYYVPLGGTRKTKALYFSYHPTHIKEGVRLPAVGPISVEGDSAASMLLGGKSYLFTGHSTDGKVYTEDSGTEAETNGSILPVIRTRRFFAQDLGLSGRNERYLLVTDADGDATTGGFTTQHTFQNQGKAEATAPARSDKDTVIGGVITLHDDLQAETFDLTISKAADETADFRLHYVGFDIEGYGMDTNN